MRFYAAAVLTVNQSEHESVLACLCVYVCQCVCVR